MSLPVFRRFASSDVPTAPNWINNIFNPLNIFCEQTVDALNKNLVIGENVQGQKFSYTFTTDPYYSTGTFTAIKLQYTGGGNPSCLLIGQVVGVLASTPFVSWSLNLNTNPYTVLISNISGLQNSTKYTINFVIL